jgi:hypothetical protein
MSARGAQTRRRIMDTRMHGDTAWRSPGKASIEEPCSAGMAGLLDTRPACTEPRTGPATTPAIHGTSSPSWPRSIPMDPVGRQCNSTRLRSTHCTLHLSESISTPGSTSLTMISGSLSTPRCLVADGLRFRETVYRTGSEAPGVSRAMTSPIGNAGVSWKGRPVTTSSGRMSSVWGWNPQTGARQSRCTLRSRSSTGPAVHSISRRRIALGALGLPCIVSTAA